ncbi:hypothetical protein K0B96_16100 [Horticoccus luteus]|uniref:Quinol:cytochrome c oxidoreductase quinone-binding subunit 2 n=1 Tax=Horticoccus luteus TaxID=2862869 RepID=A0A8F9XH08_9BACT|nr:hypothetical protein [Horticoccus luteus]QYM78805.1 hypothetical protein K0B96_16100 [Horticoccus luteus]
MNAVIHQRLTRVRRLLVGGAVLGVLVALACGWATPAAVAPAYRFAIFACLAPALGSLLFALIHQLTGGQWAGALSPFLAAGYRLAPWLWLLVLPLLAFVPHTPQTWPLYDSRGMMAIRAGIYAIVLFFITAKLGRHGLAPRWVGPAGMIVLVFMLHILAEDWLGSLDANWHSTAFALVWMTGIALSGLAAAILAALAFGVPPHAPYGGTRAIGLDLGDLMMATLLFWCYVAFAQFLIIWAGNMPEETSWFLRRLHGPWRFVPLTLAVFHFVLPFAILLSRPWKRTVGGLALAACLLIGAQLLYTAWIFLPVLPVHGWAGFGLAAALLLCGATCFAHRYLALVQSHLETSP